MAKRSHNKKHKSLKTIYIVPTNQYPEIDFFDL